MLGAAPQQKDQVHRVDRVHLALVDPGLEHRRAATEPLLIVLVEVLGQALATADHFHGEDFRRQRLAPGELHLGADITGQGRGRVVLGTQVAKGAVPQVEDVAHHLDIQPQLAAEVVVQVGLGQADAHRDAVHAGALVAMHGKFFGGRQQDGFFVLLANAPGGLRGGVGGWRFDRHGGGSGRLAMCAH